MLLSADMPISLPGPRRVLIIQKIIEPARRLPFPFPSCTGGGEHRLLQLVRQRRGRHAAVLVIQPECGASTRKLVGAIGNKTRNGRGCAAEAASALRSLDGDTAHIQSRHLETGTRVHHAERAFASTRVVNFRTSVSLDTIACSPRKCCNMCPELTRPGQVT